MPPSFRRFTGVAALTAISLLGACATLPTTPPPGSPPPIPFAERTGVPGVPHSDVIEAAGDARPAVGAVSRGEVLLRLPFRYRHTAVLTEDVTGFSLTVPGVRISAGAAGYYAGTFVSSGVGGSGPGDLWCFLRPDNPPLCLLRNQATVAAIAPTRLNPWLWTGFAPATGSFDYVNTPIFSRQPAQIPGDHVLEYRFEGWRNGAARVGEFVAGQRVREFETRPMQPLATVAGQVSITPDPENPDKARVSVTRMETVSR